MRRALAIVAVATGCATSTSGTTWDDDRREGVGTSAAAPILSAPAPSPSGPAAAHVRPPAAAYEPAEELVRRMELALLRFVAERRSLSGQLPAAKQWPEPMTTLWGGLLTELEDGFRLGPRSELPKRLLVQARVTTEAEAELTERRFGGVPSDINDRVRNVHAMIAAHMRAAAIRQPAPRGSVREYAKGGLQWPVTPVIITSTYGLRKDPVIGEEEVRFHQGLDLGGNLGDLVYAAGPGQVVFSGWSGGHGRMVVIQHAGGYMTYYAHLQKLLVSFGMDVETGAPLGQMGSTGRSTGPHLHFEVHKDGKSMDPLDAIGTAIAGL